MYLHAIIRSSIVLGILFTRYINSFHFAPPQARRHECSAFPLHRSRNSTAPLTNEEDSSVHIYSYLVVSDLAALALASQLLGLLDAVNRPGFAENGGFLQPVTLESASTLPGLVKEFSLMITLVLGTSYAQGYYLETQGRRPWLTDVGVTVLGFFMFRLGYEVLIGEGGSILPESLSVLRETYVVALFLAAERYALHK